MKFYFHSLLFLSFYFFINTQSIFAQEKFSKKSEKLRMQGDKLSDMGKYADAEKLYLKAVESSKNYSTAYQRLAYVFIQQKKYPDAYEALNRIIKIGGNFTNEVYFQMAKTCFALGKFKECDDFIFQYSATPKISALKKQELQELKDNLAFAREAVKKPVAFNPVSVGETINSPLNEYFPSLTADGEQLFFTRQIKNGSYTQEDIFFSEKQTDGTWGKSISVSNNINTPSNEGAHSISADGRFLYFTMCEQQGGYGGCDIYVSKRVGNEWSKPENLGPVINTPAKETQPCISSDGMALYFVSSRPGGFGKLDIWMTYKKPDGTWGNPINLGREINSHEIDERPYIHPDNNTLYFATDGRKGFGNADIFFARRHALGSKWNEAENMGFPINSFYYEGGIYVSTDGEKGYFATERMNPDFQLDIFEFDIPDYAKPEKITYVKGRIKEAVSGKPLQANLIFTDLENGKKVNENTSDAVTGEYLLTLPIGRDYAVHVFAKEHLFHSLNFSLKEKTDTKPYRLNIELEKIEKGKQIILENVFYEKDSFALKPSSFIELNRVADFLLKNEKIKIEISGHTDNTGKSDYNLKLSELRAKSVYDYLISKNIPSSQISYKGYGDALPAFDNNSPEGQLKNRRTEIKIINSQ
jgi:outer membrane protein OmpA-like peptidoglycan-associated protein